MIFNSTANTTLQFLWQAFAAGIQITWKGRDLSKGQLKWIIADKTEHDGLIISELANSECSINALHRVRNYLNWQTIKISLYNVAYSYHSHNQSILLYPLLLFVFQSDANRFCDIMSFEKRVRSLDIFKKTPPDVSQPTNLGGFISIVTVLLISYFTVVEFSHYLYPEYTGEINMDKLFTREEMTINLDISFPHFPCELMSLDLMDSMMSHHPNIGSVEKWRIDKQGNYIDKRSFELLREQNPFKQMETVREAIRNGYGCRMIGSFTVKEVPGNFHFSCHGYGNHYMQMKAQGVLSVLNTTHTIHSLYFGKEHHLKTIRSRHPEAALHLLQNKSAVALGGQSLHYHLDIVPTWYHESTFNNYYTYQYTYKENAYEEESQHPPVVHFNYAIGGLIVEIMPRGEDFFVFLIHLCAILGGTYAIAQAIHNLISNFTSKFEYQLIA